MENLGCSKQKIMKNNRLQKSRFASFSKTPLNPVEIQYSCGFSAYHLSKNRAYVLNVTSGTLPLPRRFARYARSSTCGERSRHSLGLQGFDIWFGGVGADRRRRAKEHQTPVQALLSDIGYLCIAQLRIVLRCTFSIAAIAF